MFSGFMMKLKNGTSKPMLKNSIDDVARIKKNRLIKLLEYFGKIKEVIFLISGVKVLDIKIIYQFNDAKKI
jgi:excinuclease UvrABC nuclease subunit